MGAEGEILVHLEVSWAQLEPSWGPPWGQWNAQMRGLAYEKHVFFKIRSKYGVLGAIWMIMDVMLDKVEGGNRKKQFFLVGNSMWEDEVGG